MYPKTTIISTITAILNALLILPFVRYDISRPAFAAIHTHKMYITVLNAMKPPTLIDITSFLTAGRLYIPFQISVRR